MKDWKLWLPNRYQPERAWLRQNRRVRIRSWWRCPTRHAPWWRPSQCWPRLRAWSGQAETTKSAAATWFTILSYNPHLNSRIVNDWPQVMMFKLLGRSVKDCNVGHSDGRDVVTTKVRKVTHGIDVVEELRIDTWMIRQLDSSPFLYLVMLKLGQHGLNPLSYLLFEL